MRKLGMLALVAIFAFALVGCGGGVNKEKVGKTYKAMYQQLLDASKEGKEIKTEDAQAKAAKDNGFKDWTDFCTQGAKALGDDWTKVTKENTDWYTAELKKLTDEKIKKAGGEKEEEKKKE